MTAPAKYRSKPATITAMQWTRDTARAPLMQFTNNLVQLLDITEDFQVYNRLSDAWIPFAYGDWIIKGTSGEFYPCDPLVFAERYQPDTIDSEPSYLGPTGRELGTLADYIPIPIKLTPLGDVTPNERAEAWKDELCRMAGVNPRWVESVNMSSDGPDRPMVMELDMRTIRISCREETER